ncbi:hypothetical protein [Mesoterricola silvestris]|uniref:DUF1214 domain-containing protein n=1 Tax=Mesoterricola silvestris TaxID=2927979 RepID=A0AA48GU41_9BACT|nr:hypothetical protein [Mesoterricola silvestris]BDU71806.1 hypothetical protein METEAL_09800 [Mesoterricola silvestris]
MRNASRPALAVIALALAGTALSAQKSGPGPERRTQEPSSAPTPSPLRSLPASQDSPRALPPGAMRGEGGAHHGTRHIRVEPPPPPPGMARVDRPRTLFAPSSNLIVAPRPLPRCRLWPESSYWKTRDLFQEIRLMARRGFIPVTPGGDAAEFQGFSYFPAGWRAYAFVVPAKQKIHVRLHHGNEGWFRLAMVDRWGQLREGMLQNLIPTGNPEVSYTNPADLANTVYVIVDDPGWMGTRENPFTLTVDRTWNPKETTAPALPAVMGIWAQAKVEVKEDDPAGAGASKTPAP